MPALESRRVRTQPLTVTGASFGASPARMLRTLNRLLSIGEECLGGRDIVQTLGRVRAMRGVTPALSARRRPLHRRLVESEEPTASPRRSPETEIRLACRRVALLMYRHRPSLQVHPETA